MGEVYRAHDDRLDRDVAVKVLPATVAHNAERLARFEREARALAQLAHPNILAIHDLGHEGDVTFTVTELLTGDTLRHRLAHERLGWRKAVDIAAAIADGLAAAHAQGIVHRDIKPENVFLTEDGRVKVLDFGLAATGPTVIANRSTATYDEADHTKPGTVLGTVGYMAPEQVESGQASARSDVFSLGSVLYEMLTGTRAFSRATVGETLAAILTAPVPELSLSGDAPPELGRIVQRCLEKRPGERFQSAQDLAFALRSAAATSAVATVREPAPAPSAVRQPSSRFRLIPAAVAATTFVAIAGVLYVILRPAPLDKSKFAIGVFKNATNDARLDPIGRQIRDQIVGGLNSLPGVSATGIEESSASTDAARRGVGRVVTGSYYLSGSDLSVQVDAREVGTNDPAYPFPKIEGPAEGQANVAERVAAYLKGAVANDSFRNWDGSAVQALPMPYDAWTEVQLGDDVSRKGGVEEEQDAVGHYLRAQSLAPRAFVPKQRLYKRYVEAGRVEDATAMLKELETIYAEQTPFSQAMDRVFREDAAGNLQAKLEASADMVRLDHSRIPPFSILGAAQLETHQLRLAEETLRHAVATPMEPGAAGMSLNNRVSDLVKLSEIHHELGQFSAQRQDARRGRQDHPDRAVFFLLEAGALIGMNRSVPEIEAVIGQARASGKLVADGKARGNGKDSMASMLGFLVDELNAHSRRADAINLAARAIEEIQKEMAGTPDPTPTQRADFRAALMQAENWPAAYAEYAAYADTNPNSVSAKGNLGVIAVKLNKQAEARSLADELLRVNRPFIQGSQHYQRARVLAALGDADASVTALNRAFAEGHGWVPGSIHRDRAFDPIREAPSFKEFCAPKDPPGDSQYRPWFVAIAVAAAAMIGVSLYYRRKSHRAA